MGWINLGLRFVRLGPLWLGLIAIAILVGGFFLQVEMNKNMRERAQVLAEGPPDTIGITAFDRSLHANAVGEVVVQAQPVLEDAYRLTLEKRGSDDHVFMVPLVGANATSETDVVGIAYYTSPSEDFENITPELLMQGSIGFGNVGPITNYNGELRGMGQWDDLTEEAFADEGLTMPARPVIVWPYQEGRDVALAPPREGALTAFGLLSKLAGAVGILALAKLVIRPQQAPAAPVQPEPVVPVRPAPVTTGRPLYQARMEDGPTMPQPQQAEPLDGLRPTTRPRRFSLYKALIGVVGVVFVLLLGSVLYGLIQESVAADQVVSNTASTPQEAMANTVADLVVPDADPDRHWTDIDVTPVIEWLVAKATLAATGDAGALQTLAMIAGGVLFAPLALWYFFRTRRAFAPKTTARFDAMGIN